MKKSYLRKISAAFLASALILPQMALAAPAESRKSVTLTEVRHYSSGLSDADGGIEEIVDYNADNQSLYTVNGKTGELDIIALDKMTEKELSAKHIQVEEKLKSFVVGTPFEGFEYGDMTSVSINEQRNLVAVAVQAKKYNENGLIVFMNYQGDILKVVAAGVQPDMLTFDEKGHYLVSANEGEPRMGYELGNEDPQGSITLVEFKGGLKKAMSTTVTFEAFDGQKMDLAKAGVILKKDAKVSEDLEPEYVTIDEKSKMAYVTLQENNAVARIDLKKKEVKGIDALGWQNHNLSENALDLIKDGEINIKNEDVYGLRMPDGIASYHYQGETYLVTANEGDSREWGDYVNEKKIKIQGEKVTTFDQEGYLGLDEAKTYIFGARSFSIFKVESKGLSLVYDSGADFEKITAEKLPEFFNVSNDNVEMDDRSGKKGPEPEGITIGRHKGRTYALIGLERTGGVMTYDITRPTSVHFQSYLNTRDYSQDIAGDVAPEGLVYIPHSKSPLKLPLLATAYEVSGTIGVYGLKDQKKSEDHGKGKIKKAEKAHKVQGRKK